MSFQLRHPVLGIFTTVLVVTAALAISISMQPLMMTAWVTLFLVAMVPPQIILSLALKGESPAGLAKLPQPWRGISFCLLTGLIGLPIAAVANMTLGGGLMPPTPFANMFLILAVTITLALVVPFQCWPFTLIFPQKPLLMGLSILIAAYAIATILFKTFFNFDFLSAAPFYQAGLNPQGLFMAWIPLIFAMTCFAVILCLVLLDFWPVAILPPLFPALGRQPWFGIISAILIALVSFGIWSLFVGKLQMDMVVFLSRVIVSLVFGVVILLIMMDGAQFLSISQPARGGVLIAAAICLSIGSFAMYKFACQEVFGLASGPPTYERELWLASAMLAVTFPMMVAYANFFQYWPFRAPKKLGEG